MKRIQRRREKGWRMPANTVYVGRPSRWGNPVVVGERVFSVSNPEIGWEVQSSGEAVGLFRRYAVGRLLRETGWLDPLMDRDLACWCPLDAPCHADVLLELVGEPAPDTEVRAK